MFGVETSTSVGILRINYLHANYLKLEYQIHSLGDNSYHVSSELSQSRSMLLQQSFAKSDSALRVYSSEMQTGNELLIFCIEIVCKRINNTKQIDKNMVNPLENGNITLQVIFISTNIQNFNLLIQINVIYATANMIK
ncbi:Hypothetical_protein [Hexamita inflata]|uniref:Hypothetical_protein n=1 Tax=Hexamita inflata TaxID=28002 RepID=A0AA86QL91_9EUKA|nr:Hypothetical protein HINF_LOCUS49251 [Hexamita inflata]